MSFKSSLTKTNTNNACLRKKLLLILKNKISILSTNFKIELQNYNLNKSGKSYGKKMKT